MAIPDYQSLMLPLLKLTADGQERRVSDTIDRLAEQFHLSEDEKNQLLPSGQSRTFFNRVQWAKTYLAQAGLLESTRRSYFRITNKGLEVLRNAPTKINIEYLRQFPDFIAFQARKESVKSKSDREAEALPTILSDSSQTPDEALRSTVKNLDNTLASELLQRILTSPPAFFESTIVSLLLGMGYGGSREEAGRAIGKSGDGGLDGVIDQDPLGLDRVYLQAKRYKTDIAVSEPEVRAFSGSLGAAKANKGVFVTTSYFTKPALDFAEKHPFKMVLIDGAQLTTLMIRHNIGVRVSETLQLKKIDEDFFSQD